VNALASERVAEYVRDRFVATYLKVGTFQIIGDRKVGGNVASYFCLPDGSVLHAVVGPANAPTFLTEARWAYEIRKTALTLSSDLSTGAVDQARLLSEVKKAHHERYLAEQGGRRLPPGNRGNPLSTSHNPLPPQLPRHVSQQGQVHWLLTMSPLARLDQVYPIVWEDILRERLSGLPVAMR
jgi:hypothetical protein